MLHTRLLALMAAVLILSAEGTTGQIVASERSTVTQVIAGTELEIDFSRPSLRGRGGPFGPIVPFDDTWTAGANASTTLRTSREIVLAGVDVPAGRYSIWLEVTEASEWRVMLHSDTTLFHAPHPPIDSAQIVLSATRQTGEDLIQTLDWRFEDLRWNGATLTLAWGRDRIRIPLDVDSGITVAVDGETAASIVGTWRIDDSGGRMDGETIEEWLQSPDLPEVTRNYLETMRDAPTRRVVEFVWDRESERLYRTDDALPSQANVFFGGNPHDPRAEILLPRGEGFFMQADVLDGEILNFDRAYAGMYEFTFGPDGRAMTFEVRNGRDEVVMTGERTRGGR